ncbi:MAG: hypothetical protein DRJ52_01395 [Thermoprotei archaeon]|nr:MAG: hypothetical protein DRJ52_01395 [Thermoprotei archaeon]
MSGEKRKNKSLFIALTSVLGSLAFVLSVTKATHIPFPILPFLKFDPSEIPSVIAFLLLGTTASILVATIHFLGLVITGAVVGGLMKYLAVLSMILGLATGKRVTNGDKVSVILAIISRVVIMSIINYILVTIFMPNILEFSEKFLKSVSITKNTLVDLLIYVSIFNTIHVIYSIIPAYIIIKYLKHIVKR